MKSARADTGALTTKVNGVLVHGSGCQDKRGRIDAVVQKTASESLAPPAAILVPFLGRIDYPRVPACRKYRAADCFKPKRIAEPVMIHLAV